MDNIYIEIPFKGINNKYNYVYKIEKIDTKQYYYGVHITSNLDDNYKGSGYLINKLYKIYNIENNFKKYIIKFFNTKEEAFEYEAKIVNEFTLKDDLCLNLIIGGLDLGL